MFQHFISTSQFVSAGRLDDFFAETDKFNDPNRSWPSSGASGLVMATWFAEPSTRTRLSFETAFQLMGGHVVSMADASKNSSALKGESWDDTVRTLAEIADIIVVRTDKEGDAARAAAASRVPVINAGDGAGEHPTQALIDAYTIYKHFGAIKGLSVALVGDLKYNRSVHSLLKLLNLHEGITYHLLAPDGLVLNPREFLQNGKLPVRVHKSMDELVDIGPDVLYMTRNQTERHPQAWGAKVASYHYDPKLHHLSLKQAERLPKSSVILHPLPRREEIAPEVDKDPRAMYWKQVKHGVGLRAALIDKVLSEA